MQFQFKHQRNSGGSQDVNRMLYGTSQKVPRSESVNLGAVPLWPFLLPTARKVDMVAGTPAAMLDLEVTLRLETCTAEQKDRRSFPHRPIILTLDWLNLVKDFFYERDKPLYI